MNLITSNWIPVRRASGAEDMIRPDQIAEMNDPPVALSGGRPDWDTALLEWLIGLHQCLHAPATEEAWRAQWDAPTPLVVPPAWEAAFDLASAYQDPEAAASGREMGVAGLVLGAPSINTLKLNKDHFVKREQLPASLAPWEAAAALITLQQWAPTGGRGHYTGARGGGPASLLWEAPTLWQRVWAHVLPGPCAPADPAGLLGWLGAPRDAEQLDEHSAAWWVCPWWSCPRRVALTWEGNRVVGALTLPASCGVDGWQHPLGLPIEGRSLTARPEMMRPHEALAVAHHRVPHALAYGVERRVDILSTARLCGLATQQASVLAWVDVQGLVPGRPDERIERAITHARSVALLLSTDLWQSRNGRRAGHKDPWGWRANAPGNHDRCADARALMDTFGTRIVSALEALCEDGDMLAYGLEVNRVASEVWESVPVDEARLPEWSHARRRIAALTHPHGKRVAERLMLTD